MISHPSVLYIYLMYEISSLLFMLFSIYMAVLYWHMYSEQTSCSISEKCGTIIGQDVRKQSFPCARQFQKKV